MHVLTWKRAFYLAASPPVPGIFDPPNRKVIPLRSPSLCGEISIWARVTLYATFQGVIANEGYVPFEWQLNKRPK
jgi:hypothetical protein